MTRAQREGSPIIGGKKVIGKPSIPDSALSALPNIGDPFGMKPQ